VVVVDDGSTDGTHDVARKAGADVIRNTTPFGVAAARNQGARHTKANILLFVDADVVAPVETLHILVDRLLERPELAATGAYPEISDLSEGWGATFVGLRASMPFQVEPRRDIVPFSSFQSECGAIRREVFDAVGGFSEEHDGVGMEEFRMGHEMEKRGYVNAILGDAPYLHHYKSLLPRCRQLYLRTSRWVPLLMERRRLESTGAVGSSMETSSCALTHLIAAGALTGMIRPRGWILAGTALGLQLILERRFFALALAQRHRGPIHLLLTDMVMPQMSGPELYRESTCHHGLP
jgi:hypothetical protein